MKNCPYCGQLNPEENQFCVSCGQDMANVSKEQIAAYQQVKESIVSKASVKFVLYFISIFLPVLGLILGLQVAATPFEGQKRFSSGLIHCACISCIVWFLLGVIVGFILAF